MTEQLSKLAKATQNTPKLSTKYEQLATACSTLSTEQYPAFLKKITGFSKLWSTTAKVAGSAIAVAGAAYLTKLAVNAYNDADTFKTDDAKKVLSTSDKAKMFGQSMLKHAKGDYDKATKMINDWRNKNTPAKISEKDVQNAVSSTSSLPQNVKDVMYPSTPTSGGKITDVDVRNAVASTSLLPENVKDVMFPHNHYTLYKRT
jgi:hypothetical protein